MQAPGIPSVDQLLVLLTVVEEASPRRCKASSAGLAISLRSRRWAQQPFPFDRGTTRKPETTHVGEAVVSGQGGLRCTASTLRARVSGLLPGSRSEVSLVVDTMHPSDRLIPLVPREFPHEVPNRAPAALVQ